MKTQKKWPLGNYGLTIVLAILFVISWLVQTWAGWKTFAAEQAAHGEKPEWLGDSGYIYQWLASTFENWQSEFLQLLTFVVLTACLIHKGSHESKDADVETDEKIDRLGEKVDRIEKMLSK